MTTPLVLVLGDQLSHDLASLADLPDGSMVALCEVAAEGRYVPHHPQKIAMMLSAMRHFAEERRERGLRVHYSALDDPDNTQALIPEAERLAGRRGEGPPSGRVSTGEQRMNRRDTLGARAPVTLYHDGHCPLCRREVAWLSRHPRRERVVLVDIQAPGFDAEALGKTFEGMMGRLHLSDADGRWFIGMDASRALYAVLGHRRLVWLSCLPGIAPLMDAGYGWFARRRLRLGRWLERRRKG
ncbi:cryptochrome/photolyase family protein [Halomonas sp. C05BenzN]|uniref:thiol-disulfide oxidoreductase DCC family protein n=1 Tax=Halomonas sp. C05BenzN TaxID=3411041 RepID=UPI003B932543